MKEYIIDLESFLDALHYNMEILQDGKNDHNVMIKAENREEAAKEWSRRIIPCIKEHLTWEI